MRAISWRYFGEPGGTRTLDPKIKSLVLYRLSYGLVPPRRLAGFERYLASAVKSAGQPLLTAVASRMWTMRSGSFTRPFAPLPRLILSTNSMP